MNAARPVHFYIYYRVAAPQVAAARAAIEAVLRALEDPLGVVGRFPESVYMST